MWWCGAPLSPTKPPPNIKRQKTNQGKLCITLKEIFGRFRISLNNCEFTKFHDFASWSQKSSSDEIGQNFNKIKYFDKIL